MRVRKSLSVTTAKMDYAMNASAFHASAHVLDGHPITGLMKNIIDFIFGCSHSNTSRVFTLLLRGRWQKRSYIVCLDCGREFEYDLENMRVIRSDDKMSPLISTENIS